MPPGTALEPHTVTRAKLLYNDTSVRSLLPKIVDNEHTDAAAENAVDPQNFEPNLALDLEISDLINTKKGNAHVLLPLVPI